MGINTAYTGRRAGVAGMGFALPADRARRVALDLIKYGRVRRAFLGVHIESAQPSSPGRPAPAGSVVIASVTPATPAAEAGLRPGDLVVAVARPLGRGSRHAPGPDRDGPDRRKPRPSRSSATDDGRTSMVRPRLGPCRRVSGLPIAGPRSPPETRQDVARGRVRGREPVVVPPPRQRRRFPRQRPGDELPSNLDPIPRTEQPAVGPSLEVPKNQPAGSPR